ncbi:Peptidyl-prolyl cis-trans isomerase, cyclophilin-type [Pseudohyphozyma bogoriensis]|nr:Peptidyl-prolyl cis-trans isomerase, cyclophilin-type [Pseudohyphozyma bogoriensis]
MPNPRCFMDFSIEGQLVGRVIFELFADVVPRTAENFRALCTGSAGVNTAGVPLYYKGSLLHRIIAGFMVQGGDFTLRNGKGGESIYGGTFEDEDLKREIDAEGLLVMANRGKNTNGSQFFVSLRPCPHLAGKHVVFGRVVKGYDIIEGLSKLPTNEKDFPVQLVTISNCGELELRKTEEIEKKAEEQRLAMIEEQKKRREEEERKREEERTKKRNEWREKESGGTVKYKGRGNMKAPGVGGYNSGGMRGW